MDTVGARRPRSLRSTALLAAALVAGCATASATPPPSATRLVVTAQPRAGLHAVPVVLPAVTDRTAISQAEKLLLDLPKVPDSVYHCPMDTGAALRLDFYDGSRTLLMTAQVALSGCQFVTIQEHGQVIGGNRRGGDQPTGRLGRILHLTLPPKQTVAARP